MEISYTIAWPTGTAADNVQPVISGRVTADKSINPYLRSSSVAVQ